MNQPQLESGSKSYIIGFIASLLLTVIPFYGAATHELPTLATYILLCACAVMQVIVHLIYFLHLETHTENGRWNVVSLVFAAIVVFIVIAGSVWIMWNLNINMAM